MSPVYVVLNPLITIFMHANGVLWAAGLGCMIFFINVMLMGLWIEPVRDLLPFIIELRSRPRRDVNGLLTLAVGNLLLC